MVVFFSAAIGAFAASISIASHGYSHDTWLEFCATEALAVALFLLAGLLMVAGVGVCDELRRHCGDC
jgi:hypothetical protein